MIDRGDTLEVVEKAFDKLQLQEDKNQPDLDREENGSCRIGVWLILGLVCISTLVYLTKLRFGSSEDAEPQDSSRDIQPETDTSMVSQDESIDDSSWWSRKNALGISNRAVAFISAPLVAIGLATGVYHVAKGQGSSQNNIMSIPGLQDYLPTIKSCGILALGGAIWEAGKRAYRYFLPDTATDPSESSEASVSSDSDEPNQVPVRKSPDQVKKRK